VSCRPFGILAQVGAGADLVFLIDYIRVYTKDGFGTVGCDPPDYPTAKYIADHENAYTKYVHV
jgi:hypothetical protein